LSDIAVANGTNARESEEINVLGGQHTSTGESMDQPVEMM
jgi:hypothetical protein